MGNAKRQGACGTLGRCPVSETYRTSFGQVGQLRDPREEAVVVAFV